MKCRHLILPLILPSCLLTVSGQDDYSSTTMAALHQIEGLQTQRENDRPKKPDPKRIINTSQSLLKEREPEMTAEEYALYEKISLMLSSQPEFAIKLLEAMMNDKEAPSPAFEFMLGNAYFSAKQMDKAEAHFQNAVKRYPTFIRAWNNLGVLYYTADKFAQAAPCFSKAVTLGDHEPATFGLLGFCLERAGNAVGAEMAYMQALAGDPDSVDWMEGLLRVYIQGRQYGRAESLVKTLLKLRPGESRFWQAYASVLLAQNRKLEATVVLETSVGAGIAGPNELNLLGDLYAEQGLYTEAAGIYLKIMTATSDVGEQKLLHFAQVLIQAGKLAQADDVLGRLRSVVTPSGRRAYLQTQADLLAARRQWPEARVVLQELLQNDPLNGNALLSLGRAYVAEGDLIHASFAFESALPVPDATYRACLELANIEVKNRHFDKCVEYLQRALAIEKTDAVQDFLVRVKTLVVKSD
jgi:tetratricopeptide (TPR) repeat protein